MANGCVNNRFPTIFLPQNQYGVNVACIENVSPFDFACVEVNDGVTHPSDGGSSGVVGYLRYEPKKSPPVETGGKNI
ncbi:hypothetical protein DNV43_03710 [Salmonella enterica subsp. enterica serovar Monschaui]|nr:hypothetical protein [Salmonella enterica subsp. enterica serovar Monschaui]EDZ0758923.1 hypothetical protein [Salmonella enterica]EHA5317028.1 hypothetical protein [Salmonella enterica]